ncbi:MAG: TIGR03643 family protein [Pontiellaceae bacterium]
MIPNDDIIELAWKDSVSFLDIHKQYGISEGEVIKIMRNSLKNKSFNRWRARMYGRHSIHYSKKNNIKY